MRGSSLICVMGVAGWASAACAQSASDDLLAPRLTLDGSLPFGFSSNPGQDKSNPRPGNFFSPYFQIAASGSLRDNFGYVLYANTNMDNSLTRLTTDSNDSQAAIGATLSRRWGDLSVHVTAERGLYFDRLYESYDSAANNFSLTTRYSYFNADRNLSIRPSASFATRLDDNFDVIRYTFNASVDFERRINGPLWLVVTPRLRYYLYESGSNSGRRDTLGSISAGLRYTFNDYVSLTTGAGYEKRVSNFPDKGYNNFIIGTSLDFSFGLDGRDWLFETPPRDAYAQSRR